MNVKTQCYQFNNVPCPNCTVNVPTQNPHCLVRKVRSTAWKICVVFMMAFLFALTMLTGVWIFGDSSQVQETKMVYVETNHYKAEVRKMPPFELGIPVVNEIITVEDDALKSIKKSPNQPLIRTKRIDRTEKGHGANKVDTQS